MVVVVGVVVVVTRHYTRRQQAADVAAEARPHDEAVVMSDLVRLL